MTRRIVLDLDESTMGDCCFRCPSMDDGWCRSFAKHTEEIVGRNSVEARAMRYEGIARNGDGIDWTDVDAELERRLSHG